MQNHHSRTATWIATSCLIAASLCCGGDGTPAGPTPTDPTRPPESEVPIVAGNYVGTTSAWLHEKQIDQEVFLGEIEGRLTVIQDGTRITIKAEGSNEVFQLYSSSGTIDAQGRYTVEDPELRNDPTCGQQLSKHGTGQFTGDRATFEGSWETAICSVRSESEYARE